MVKLTKPVMIEKEAEDNDKKTKKDKKDKLEKTKNEKKKKSKKTKLADDDLMKDLQIEALNDDDSFMNPPASVKTVGKFQVKNFSTRTSKDPAPEPAELKYANKKPAATCLNNKISFQLLTQAKFAIKDTPKNIKSKKVSDVQAGPAKKLTQPIKPKFDPEHSPDAKTKLETKLDAIDAM